MRLRTTCALLLAVGSLALADATTDPPVGQQAKEFPATDTFGIPATKNPLKLLKGRVVLLTVFQSWYSSCADAVPDINGVYDKWGPKGLTVLAVGEQERKTVEPWIAEKGVRFPWALIDTPTAEKFKRDWPAPGQPWSFLIDVDGKIVWQENPRNLQNRNVFKPGTMEPLLAATTQAPVLPKALAEHQKLLDDGLWAAAKKALSTAAAEAKLEKADAGWAKGTSEWIQSRHDKWMADIEALGKKGWWWDAWEMANDFPRRFEGMEGAEAAAAKAAEIRKVPEAAKDLAQGDDVAKAKGLIGEKKHQNARLILTRISKEAKGTRHAERAQEMLEKLPAK